MTARAHLDRKDTVHLVYDGVGPDVDLCPTTTRPALWLVYILLNPAINPPMGSGYAACDWRRREW